MSFLHTIDPIALQLGPLGIHWYGLMYLVAFGLAYLLGQRRVAQGRLPISADAFSDLIFLGMLGVILGGRIGYMLFYSEGIWLREPLALLRVWEGGMSFHGGLLGVMVAGWWWSRKHRIVYWDTIDFAVPLFPTGLGVGRIGNFIGGELYGKPTGGDWGVVFPGAVPEPFASMTPTALRAAFDAGQLDPFLRHPSQLYQAFLEGVLLFAIVWWFSSRPRPRYAVSGLFAVVYGLFRFAVEFVREPDAQLGYLAFDWLTMGQVLSLPLIAVGVVLLVLAARQPRAQGPGHRVEGPGPRAQGPVG